MGDTGENGQSPLWHEFDQFLAYIAVNPGHRPLALEPGVGGDSSTDAMDVMEVRSVDWQTAQNGDEMQAGQQPSLTLDTLTKSLSMDCQDEDAFGSWNSFSDALLETTLNLPPAQSPKAGYAEDLQQSIAATAELGPSIVEKPTMKEIAINGETVSVLNTDGTRKRKRSVDKGSIKLLMKLASSIADLQTTDHAADEILNSQKKLKCDEVEEVEHDFSEPLGSVSPEDSQIESDNTLLAFTVSEFDAICKSAITHAALEECTGRRFPRVPLNFQPVLVRKSGSNPDEAYHILQVRRGIPKPRKNMLKAQDPPPVPLIQKRKQMDDDSAEFVRKKKLKKDCPLPLPAPSMTQYREPNARPKRASNVGHRMKIRALKMGVKPSTSGTARSASMTKYREPNARPKRASNVGHRMKTRPLKMGIKPSTSGTARSLSMTKYRDPKRASNVGHRMKTRGLQMDVTPSTSGTARSPEAELPKQAVDGRRNPNVPSKYRCGTCHKTYLGNRMQHHQAANPTHRTVAELEGETSKSSREGTDVQSLVATESAPTRSDNEEPTGRLKQLMQIVSAEPEPYRSRLMQEFWQQMRDLTPNLTGVADHSSIDNNEQNKTLPQNVQHMVQAEQDNSAPGGPVMGGGLVQPNVSRAMEVNTTPLGRVDIPSALPNCILDELLVASGIELLDDLSVLELDQHDLF